MRGNCGVVRTNCRGEERKHGEATAKIKAREEGGLNQDSGCGSGEKWLNSPILKTEPTRLVG